MVFKYQHYYDKLRVECPPGNYKPVRIVVYRWVFNFGDKRNFQTQYEKFLIKFSNPSTPPRRYNDISDLEKREVKMCEDMSLSLFVSMDAAEKGFLFWKEDRNYQEKAFEIFGKYVASAEIFEEDGVNGPVDGNGHFNHHPFIGFDYETRFQIISCFIK